MNAESIWMSGPSLSQSFDANVEPYLETSECEKPADDTLTKAPAAIGEEGNFLNRLIVRLFNKPMTLATNR